MSTGAGDIFGTTGGVMEATLRTACELVTGQAPADLDFTEVRAVEGVKETSIDIGGTVLNVGVANGLQNAKTLLDKVISGEKPYPRDRGHGLPRRLHRRRRPALSASRDARARSRARPLRAQALYAIDGSKTLRKSHENPAIERLYEHFLGAPNSHPVASCCTPTTSPSIREV